MVSPPATDRTCRVPVSPRRLAARAAVHPHSRALLPLFLFIARRWRVNAPAAVPRARTHASGVSAGQARACRGCACQSPGRVHLVAPSAQVYGGCACRARTLACECAGLAHLAGVLVRQSPAWGGHTHGWACTRERTAYPRRELARQSRAFAHDAGTVATPCGRWVRQCPAFAHPCGALAGPWRRFADAPAASARRSRASASACGHPVHPMATLACTCRHWVDPAATSACACQSWVDPAPALACAVWAWVRGAETSARACRRQVIPPDSIDIQLNLTCRSSGDLAPGFHALNPDAVSGPRSGAKGRGRISEVQGELR